VDLLFGQTLGASQRTMAGVQVAIAAANQVLLRTVMWALALAHTFGGRCVVTAVDQNTLLTLRAERDQTWIYKKRFGPTITHHNPIIRDLVQSNELEARRLLNYFQKMHK